MLIHITPMCSWTFGGIFRLYNPTSIEVMSHNQGNAMTLTLQQVHEFVDGKILKGKLYFGQLRCIRQPVCEWVSQLLIF